MVLALAALAAAAASFPTGFGFGAGYGAGVRIGYDVIYPKIAGQAAKITDDILASMNKLFGGATNVPISSGGTSGFEFSSTRRPLTPADPHTDRGKSAKIIEVANPCLAVQARVRSLQKSIVSVFNLLQSVKRKPRSGGSVRAQEFKLKRLALEMDSILSNPNNSTCLSNLDLK